MKVFALGGYGKVGLPAIKLLAQSDLVTEIAVVGRSLERAEKAITEIGEKAIAVHADGTDEQELTSLMEGYDIIMNAAYDDSVLSTIRAAIRTGAHYCDVNGVIEPALQLASEARAANITVIVATGIGPCISNLMGVHVARQLDEVEQIQREQAGLINFQSGRQLTPRQWLEQPQRSLAVLQEVKPFITWMLQRLQENGARTVREYHGGRWVEIDPIRRGVHAPGLEGGSLLSHPFVSTDDDWGALPTDVGERSAVDMWASALPPQLDAVLREQTLRVLEENIDPDTATSSFYDTVNSDPQHWLTLPDDYTPVPAMWVRAVGRKDGRAARCNCWFTAPIWDVGGHLITSAALVAAARKILRGEIQARGVMTAETAFEPQSFFDEVVAVLPEPPPDGKLIGESFEWLE